MGTRRLKRAHCLVYRGTSRLMNPQQRLKPNFATLPLGFHGDLNATYPVGKVNQESLDLMSTTKKAMEEAIAICRPGVPYRDIGNKIEEVVKPNGYSIVRRYTGHGIHNLVHRLHEVGTERLTIRDSFIVNRTSCTTEGQKRQGRWKWGRFSQ